jgi:hypothetical protein
MGKHGREYRYIKNNKAETEKPSGHNKTTKALLECKTRIKRIRQGLLFQIYQISA